jgi:hypothetical protein
MPFVSSLLTKLPRNTVVLLGVDKQLELINVFWPHLKLAKEDYISEVYQAFFDFISRSLQELQPHSSAFAAQDLPSLLAIVETSSTECSSTKEEIVVKIKPNYFNAGDAEIKRSIELGLRMWLGIHISSKGISIGPVNSRNTRIEWPDNQTLEALVTDEFKPFPLKTAPIDLPLQGSFNAVSLKRICRLQIRWTDNLADHLKLAGTRGQRSLSIYRHKICLINHRKAPGPTIIPLEILDEAIHSLDLLFPFGHSETDDFLASEQVQLHAPHPFGLPRATELDDFRYWRSNIAQLLLLLNGPPETVAQTLLDTRNLPQIATMWIAIFGVFFLTILFGCLSTVYAVKQYLVAVKAYQLSVDVACVQSADSLPQYCR